MNRLNFRTRLLLLVAVLAIAPAWADDVPADYEERARLLKELLDRDRRLPAATLEEPATLPGARLDAQTLRYRQELQLRRSGDLEWRQLLGEQQADSLRGQISGVPSIGAPSRALGFDQQQRMRELSTRILQQDQQYRFDSRSPR
jgi:hypothetical protein